MHRSTSRMARMDHTGGRRASQIGRQPCSKSVRQACMNWTKAPSRRTLIPHRVKGQGSEPVDASNQLGVYSPDLQAQYSNFWIKCVMRGCSEQDAAHARDAANGCCCKVGKAGQHWSDGQVDVLTSQATTGAELCCLSFSLMLSGLNVV